MRYRNVRQARTVDQINARKRMQQQTHGLVLVVQGDRSIREVGEIASKTIHWWEDLRRGQNGVYGALLRFIDVSVSLGTPKPVLKQIPRLIDWYIEDVYEPTHAAEITLVA